MILCQQWWGAALKLQSDTAVGHSQGSAVSLQCCFEGIVPGMPLIWCFVDCVGVMGIIISNVFWWGQISSDQFWSVSFVDKVKRSILRLKSRLIISGQLLSRSFQVVEKFVLVAVCWLAGAGRQYLANTAPSLKAISSAGPLATSQRLLGLLGTRPLETWPTQPCILPCQLAAKRILGAGVKISRQNI